MAETINLLDKLRQQLRNLRGSIYDAQQWFRNMIRDLVSDGPPAPPVPPGPPAGGSGGGGRRRGPPVSGNRLMTDRKDRLRPTNQVHNTKRYLGRMIMFYYDPLHKDNPKVLPFYDMFPLVIPFNLNAPSPKNGPGFLGLNLHYLPIGLRARLLQQLMALYNNKHLNENKKLQLSWQIIKNNASIKYYKPCVKWYLLKQIRSKILVVDPLEWEYMLTLPTERFVRNTKKGVWRDSKNKLGIR